jgi:hypothetical protein
MIMCDVICSDCKKRKAKITYSSEPIMALTHGWGKIEICRQCFIKRIKTHIEECNKQLRDEIRLLEKEKRK